MAEKFDPNKIIKPENSWDKLSKESKDLMRDLGLELITLRVTCKGTCPKCKNVIGAKIEYVTLKTTLRKDSFTAICPECSYEKVQLKLWIDK